MLIFPCQLISDLKLLGRKEPWCMCSDSAVILQCDFGSKQAQSGHHSPPVQFARAPGEELCQVSHIHAYLVALAEFGSPEAFFLTTVPPHAPAALVKLHNAFLQSSRAPGFRSHQGLAEHQWPPGSGPQPIFYHAGC